MNGTMIEDGFNPLTWGLIINLLPLIIATTGR